MQMFVLKFKVEKFMLSTAQARCAQYFRCFHSK